MKTKFTVVEKTKNDGEKELAPFKIKEKPNKYKEEVYGIYHNTLIDIHELLCSSEKSQRKVSMAMGKIIESSQKSHVVFNRIYSSK